MAAAEGAVQVSKARPVNTLPEEVPAGRAAAGAEAVVPAEGEAGDPADAEGFAEPDAEADTDADADTEADAEADAGAETDGEPPASPAAATAVAPEASPAAVPSVVAQPPRASPPASSRQAADTAAVRRSRRRPSATGFLAGGRGSADAWCRSDCRSFGLHEYHPAPSELRPGVTAAAPRAATRPASRRVRQAGRI